MTRCVLKRCLAILLLPLLVSLACNLRAPSTSSAPGGLPAEAPDDLPGPSPDGEMVGGSRPDEPTPDLSSLSQFPPPPEGQESKPALESAEQARLFRYFPSSDELPESFGKTRRQPYALHTLVRTGSWDFQVRELLRGQAAWEFIQDQSPDAVPPPSGKEYLLAWVWARCKIAAEGDWDIGLFELYLTAGSGLAHIDSMWGMPSPEPYYNEIYSGMEVEGWLDFLIDSSENDILLVFDKEDTDISGEDQVTRFYVALQEGASLALPDELAASQPNGLGAGTDSPVPPGQTAVTQNWQITLLESLRGEAALNQLKERHENNPEPEAGMEYISFRARLRSISKQDQVFWFSNSNFIARDAAGQTYNLDSIFTDSTKPGSWLQGGLFPGGELEGWGFLQVPVSESNPILVFAPDGLFGEELVYLAMQP